MELKDIKTKKAWRKILPLGYHSEGIVSSFGDFNTSQFDNCMYQVVTQSDFLREFYPSGHIINDPNVYPDIYREEFIDQVDDEGNKTGKQTRRLYRELVPRYAFSFQQIITVKQIVHLCGNDIQFELNVSNPTETQSSLYNSIREGWSSKDMEVAFYKACRSVKVTGDTAFVGFIENGEFGYKVLSFMEGDTLYPHYSRSGKLTLFARSYYNYDEDGNKVIEWLEVWDDMYLSTYKKNQGKNETTSDKIKKLFGIDGYSLMEKKRHGFPFIPVSYKRNDDGACWSPAQDSIDGYEMTFSQMSQNNKASGNPILLLQGDNTTEIGSTVDVNGTIKVMTLGKDDKASYLEAKGATESFMKELDTLYKMIYEQSFTVIPPSLKSGDLPAAALKILYSPAYEKSMIDCQEYQSLLNGIMEIFLFGYGLEKKSTIDFKSLPMKWWIKPYVHVNDTSVVTDLASAVQNGFISKQTASERITTYSTPFEWDRIMVEQKEKQQQDILKEISIQNNKNGTN